MCFFLIIEVALKKIVKFDWKYFVRFVSARFFVSIVLGLLATCVYTKDSYINVFLIGYIISYVTSVHLTSVKDISKLLGE